MGGWAGALYAPDFFLHPYALPCNPSPAPLILQVGGLGTFGNGRVLFLEVSDLPSVAAVTGLQVGRGLMGVGGVAGRWGRSCAYFL